MSASLEAFVEELQAAYRNASGAQPSHENHIRVRWHKIAHHILDGIRETSDVHHLSIELHHAFIGDGHRTEILHRAEDDPVLLGWRGVASWVLEQQKVKMQPAVSRPDVLQTSEFG